MIFIDTSAYLSALIPSDSNRIRAIELFTSLISSQDQFLTSYAVLGEVLTVATQRYNRQEGIRFVKEILEGSTRVIMEDRTLLDKTFMLFEDITNKNVGWVDCYSFAIIEKYKVKKAFSFDKDFRKHARVEIIA